MQHRCARHEGYCKMPDQGFDPVGKGHADCGLSVVFAAGAAFSAGVLTTVLVAGFAGAVFLAAAGLATATFFAGASSAAAAFLARADLTAGVTFLAGVAFSTATAAFVEVDLATGVDFLATAALGAGAAFFAAVFFAVAIQFSLISLQRALHANTCA
ncbi:MAG: hypothetical protein IPN53_00910 [Comamonadaceae bacterium]|nr:hypothetical protein [Comamonadaceae bacterium]